MKRDLFLRGAAILAMLAIAGCATNAKKAAEAPSNEIVIGTAGPMEGPLAAFGEQLRRGVQAAVTDINGKGGVLGKKLRLAVADDRCQPPKAVPTAEELIEQGAVFVVGHFCSGTSIPAAKVYSAANVLQITPSSSNTELTEQGIPTVLRVTNRDDAQGIFAGTWLAKTYAGRNLAVIDDEQPYGRDVAGQAAKTAESFGLKPALMGSFKKDARDFSDLIARLKAAKIDVVFVGGYHDEVGPFAKQAREQGFDGAFVSDDALNTSDFMTYAGSAADGVRFADASSKTELPSAQQVVAKFRNGDYPFEVDRRYDPEGYTLNAYAAVQVFAAAAAGTGSTDARRMADWLKANHVPTVIGDLSWDAKGDLKELYYAWYAWENGQYRQQPD